MNFALDDQQRMLVETVRTFIANELEPLEDEVERTGVLEPEMAHDIHAKAKALGLYAMNIPEQFGGGGLSAMPGVIDAARAEFRAQLAGYPGLPEHDEPEFLVPAVLGGMAGPAGTLILAERVATAETPAGT